MNSRNLRHYLEKERRGCVKAIAILVDHWKAVSWKRRASYVLGACVLYVVVSTGKEVHVEVATGTSTNAVVEEKEWTGERPNAIKDSTHPHAHICKCTDPKEAVPRDATVDSLWWNHHQTMVKDVQWAGGRPLDVVLLGDSLIEGWNGTHRWGTQSKPAQRDVFESLFTRAGGGSLEGLALGSSADTAPNLLWHLQNGLLQDSLQPKVWVILVGTNDLVGTRCSHNVTLEGIVAVVDYLASQRPQADVLIHGLLPRGEGGRKAMTLGHEWERIRQVNQRLHDVCRRHQWHYWDTGILFLNHNRTKLHSRLIGDGIHPRISGMKLWGPKLVQAIKEIVGGG